jgi:hypothetical protein
MEDARAFFETSFSNKWAWFKIVIFSCSLLSLEQIIYFVEQLQFKQKSCANSTALLSYDLSRNLVIIYIREISYSPQDNHILYMKSYYSGGSS